MAFLLTNSQSHVIPHQHSTNDIIGLIELIENNAVVVSASAPANPSAGKLWYNTTKGVFNIYNGSSWILVGPEVTPITKAQYDALSSADKNDGRFYLITDNDGTILVEWDNVLNKPLYIQTTAPSSPTDGYLWYDTTNHILKVYNTNAWTPVDTDTTYSAGDGIDIDANNNNAISVDVTDIIGTGLSEDANNNIIVDTTVVATQTDLTNGLSTKQDTINDLNTIRSGAAAGATAVQPLDNVSSLTNDAGYITNAVSDLTNYYTKTQTYSKTEVDNLLSDFGGFEVVEQLPAVATANPHIIYLLGPIGTGGDRYEERIVTESTLYTNETLDANNPTVNITTPYTLAAADCSATYDHGDVHTISLISGGNSLGAYVGNNKFVLPEPEIVLSPTIEVPAGVLSTSGFDSYTSITLPVPSGTTKTWTKIGETSVDLSNYFNTFTDTADSINNGTNHLFVSPSEKSTWNAKQDALVSGTNIKTVNGNSLLGSGNVDIPLGKNDIVRSTLPPQDTTVLWYDTVNFVLNYYNDNAWKPLGVVNGGSVEPDYNITGNLWYDINNNVLRVYRVGTGWKDLAYGTSASTAPITVSAGHIWYDTTNNILKVYNGTVWEDVNTNTTYKAGDGIDISNDEISIDTTVVATKTDLNSKQDTISDLATIRSGASAGATAIQPNDNVSELTNDAGYITSSALEDYSTTTEMNNAISTATSGLATESYVNTALSSKQDTLTAGANITIAQDGTISATDTTYTAGTGIDITNGVISNTQTSAEWGNITGTLSDQTDLQDALNDKQDTISDLATIRSNATAGKSASDTIVTYGDIVTHNASEFATTAQGALADTAVQPGDNVSDLTNDAGYITNSALNGYATESYVDTGLAAKADKSELPTKTSDLTNDSGFITNAVNDLANYYTKTETYTKTEVDNLISSFGNFEVVASLPSVSTASEKTIYLLGPIGTGADKYEEWIVTEDSQQQKQWTKIGETSVDLSGYATTTALTNGLATKQDTLTPGDGIDIDGSNNISVDVTDIIGTGLSEDANNNIIVDYDTVANALAGGGLEYNSGTSTIDVDYDYVSQELAGPGLYYTNGTIAVDTTEIATQTDLAGKQDELTTGDGIDIDANNEISVDVTDIIGTGLSEDASNNIIIDTTVVATQTDLSGKQDKATSGSGAPNTTPTYVGQQYVDTTNNILYVAKGTSSSSDWIVAGKTYSAGTGLTLNGTQFAVDTTTIATKSDIANLSSFEVVDTLPSTSTASTKTIYLLGPIGTGADKYEEWIITNPTIEDKVTISSSSTSATVSDAVTITASDISITRASGFIIAYYIDVYQNGSKLFSYSDGGVPSGLLDANGDPVDSITIPAGTISASDFSTITSISIKVGEHTEKTWTKIGETSIDLSGYALDSNVNTKTFTLSSASDLSTIRDAIVWKNAGKNPIIAYNGYYYETGSYSSGSSWTLYATKVDTSVSGASQNKMVIAYDMGSPVSITISSDAISSGASGDMLYSDYGWTTLTGASVTLALRSEITPSANFTVNKPNDLKDGQFYVLRVDNGATAYTMTLGTDVTNPYSEDLTLVANNIQQFMFLAKGGNLELQPSTEIDISGKQDKATSGSGAPSTTPTYIGQQYVDTTNDTLYVATGTSSSSDWTEVGAGSGDMAYADFNWVTKTGATITLDLNSTITPSANFTVNAPSTIKDGQVYILRVVNGATAYTMTLGTGITNPYSTSTTLTANYIDQFVFQAIGGSLELLPDSDVDITGKQDKATTGTAAPSSTPTYVGQSYVNTSTTTPFVATGTSASTDWQGIPILSKQTGAATNVKIWVGTQAAYEALSGSYDANTLYFTTSSS